MRFPCNHLNEIIRKLLAVCELFFVVSSISAMAMGDDGEDDDEK